MTSEARRGKSRNIRGIVAGFLPLRYFFAFLLSVSILSCSHPLPQTKQESPEPTPLSDCARNYAKEIDFSSSTLHKTWVKYEALDYDKAFDAALFSLQNNGHSVTATDRARGTIHGEVAAGQREQSSSPPCPVDVKITKESASLIVTLSFKVAGKDKGLGNLCRFYEEFESLVKKIPSPTPPGEAPKPPPRPIRPTLAKVEAPHTPVAKDKAVPSPRPSPSPSGSLPLRVTEVAWSSVNLREGPGMNYRVVGSAKKSTPLRILDEKGGWLHVRLEDGKEVWVSTSATLETAKAAPASSPPPPSKPLPTRLSPM
jgi:hypothetical protein